MSLHSGLHQVWGPPVSIRTSRGCSWLGRAYLCCSDFHHSQVRHPSPYFEVLAEALLPSHANIAASVHSIDVSYPTQLVSQAENLIRSRTLDPSPRPQNSITIASTVFEISCQLASVTYTHILTHKHTLNVTLFASNDRTSWVFTNQPSQTDPGFLLGPESLWCMHL